MVALEIACADFLLVAEGGLDVPEALLVGILLGGQRQRLTITRAVLYGGAPSWF